MELTHRDGIGIAFESTGSGIPRVLLHGFSDSQETWHEQGYVAGFVSHGRRVITTDARGHGASSKPHDPALYGRRVGSRT